MRFLRRIWLPAAGVVLLGALVLGYRFKTRVDVGVGFAAHQLCSCIFIAGRSQEDCRQDLLPESNLLKLEVKRDGDQQLVRAWVSGVARRTAVHTSKTGCILQ